jgi:hypothetical protein
MRMRGCELVSSGSEQKVLVGSCERGNKSSGCITEDKEYLEELSGYQPFKMHSALSATRVTRELHLCTVMHYCQGQVCQGN